jgi:hypothetical protein
VPCALQVRKVLPEQLRELGVQTLAMQEPPEQVAPALQAVEVRAVPCALQVRTMLPEQVRVLGVQTRATQTPLEQVLPLPQAEETTRPFTQRCATVLFRHATVPGVQRAPSTSAWVSCPSSTVSSSPSASSGSAGRSRLSTSGAPGSATRVRGSASASSALQRTNAARSTTGASARAALALPRNRRPRSPGALEKMFMRQPTPFCAASTPSRRGWERHGRTERDAGSHSAGGSARALGSHRNERRGRGRETPASRSRARTDRCRALGGHRRARSLRFPAGRRRPARAGCSVGWGRWPARDPSKRSLGERFMTPFLRGTSSGLSMSSCVPPRSSSKRTVAGCASHATRASSSSCCASSHDFMSCTVPPAATPALPLSSLASQRWRPSRAASCLESGGAAATGTPCSRVPRSIRATRRAARCGSVSAGRRSHARALSRFSRVPACRHGAASARRAPR